MTWQAWALAYVAGSQFVFVAWLLIALGRRYDELTEERSRRRAAEKALERLRRQQLGGVRPLVRAVPEDPEDALPSRY